MAGMRNERLASQPRSRPRSSLWAMSALPPKADIDRARASNCAPATSEILGALTLWQSIECNGGHVRSPDPRGLELRPERHEQQRAEGRNLIHASIENVQAGRVGPMGVFED